MSARRAVLAALGRRCRGSTATRAGQTGAFSRPTKGTKQRATDSSKQNEVIPQSSRGPVEGPVHALSPTLPSLMSHT